ncbi:MAG: cytochrome c [Pseudomonadota bacterium]
MSRRLIVGTLAVVVAIITGGVIFVFSGIYNVAADDRHWTISYRVMESIRSSSIKARASGITTPQNLDGQEKIASGAVHYATHCANCHSAPGVKAEEWVGNMYPTPPQLTDTARNWKPSELFWIIKHGIKMSGMPSWAEHGDDQIWNTVSFLRRLPNLSADDYSKLAAAAAGHRMNNGAVENKETEAHRGSSNSTHRGNH